MLKITDSGPWLVDQAISIRMLTSSLIALSECWCLSKSNGVVEELQLS